MEIKGKIIKVMEPITGQGKKGPWAKQEFILEQPGQYPKPVSISLWGDQKITDYDLEPGLEVTAYVDIESKENNGRWYTEIRAWKIHWNAQQIRKWEPKTN